MEEKNIINDILESSKHLVMEYENVILSTMDMELRQAFQNIRNTAENFQYELKKLSETKGYSSAVEEATIPEIQKLNLLFRI